MGVDASTIIEKAEMRSFLNIPDSDTDMDTLLEKLLDQYNDAIEDYIGVVCINVTYTESYDGDGTDCLFVDHAPIVSITTLTIDDVAVDAADFYIYKPEGKIKLDSDIFTKDNQSVDIVYEAGHGADRASVPEPLKLALKTWVARIYKADFVDFTPELGEEAARVQSNLAGIPWDIRRMLANYKIRRKLR